MENDLRAADQDLAKQRTVLSPEAYGDRRRDLERRFTDAQQTVQNRRREIDQAAGEAYNKVVGGMLEVVAGLATDNDYKIVDMARYGVVRWLARYNRSYLTPEQGQLKNAEEALAQGGNKLDARVQSELKAGKVHVERMKTLDAGNQEIHVQDGLIHLIIFGCLVGK